VVIPVSTGFTLGTLIVYGLCYRFGKTGLDRFGKYLRFNWEDVLALHTRFSKGKYDEVFVFFARAVPFFPSTVVNAFYGVIRWNPFKFILITFLGIFVRATILGFLGWQLGHLYKAHIVKIQMVQSHIFSLISLVVLGFLVRAYLKRRSKRRKETVL